MSQRRSRVKKYEKLREEIMNETSDKIETKELSPFANQLHRLDDEQFENMDVSSYQEHQPLHLRRETFDVSSTDSDPVDNEKLDYLLESASESMIEDTDSFRSNYLADFIDEAKQYNLEKGYRVDHDTKSNLLRELKAQHLYHQEDQDDLDEVEVFEDELIETLEPEYIQEEEEVEPEIELEPEHIEQDDFEHTMEFQSTELETHPVAQEVSFEETIMMQVARLAENEMSEEDFLDEYAPSDLLEATTKLKVQLDQQSEVVKDMESKIDKTSRSMNILLTVLITTLVILLAVFGYVFLRIFEII